MIAGLLPDRYLIQETTETVEVTTQLSVRPVCEQLTEPLTLEKALRMTLSLQPNLQLAAESTQIQYGNYLFQKGQFDTNLDLDARYETIELPLLRSARPAQRIKENRRNFVDLSGALNKQFGNGIVLGGSLRLTRLNDDIKEFLNIPPENRNTINFTVTVPFFKGKKVGLTADAALLDYNAENATFRQTLADVVLNTASLYWRYVSEYEQMKVLQNAVEHDEQIVSGIRQLVKKEEKAASELNLARANLAARRDRLAGSEQRYYEAKRDLAIAMGYETSDVYMLPRPGTQFPVVRSFSNSQSTVDDSIMTAEGNRQDLLAAKDRAKASELLTEVAHTNLGPDFSGRLTGQYDGLSEGGDIFDSITGKYGGPNAIAELNYAYPLQNNQAKGTFKQQSAEHTQDMITLRNLWREIKLNLLAALNNSRVFGRKIGLSKRAVHFFQLTFDAEVEKLKLGESSLLDTLRIEDQLIENQLIHVNNRALYAASIADYAFQQGILMCADDVHCEVNLEELL